MRFILAPVFLILAACTGGRNYHLLDEAAPSGAPRFLELQHSAQVATLHFPAGTYVLEAADDLGFFYRAPEQIRESDFHGSFVHDGGLYLAKSGHLRGYVTWYDGIVHVGNLSRADYFLHN